MEKKICLRCKKKMNLQVLNKDICYKCLSDIRANEEKQATVNLAKFEKFMEIYALKPIRCICGKNTTIKEGHDNGWIKLPHGPFLCEVCKKRIQL